VSKSAARTSPLTAIVRRTANDLKVFAPNRRTFPNISKIRDSLAFEFIAIFSFIRSSVSRTSKIMYAY